MKILTQYKVDNVHLNDGRVIFCSGQRRQRLDAKHRSHKCQRDGIALQGHNNGDNDGPLVVATIQYGDNDCLL